MYDRESLLNINNESRITGKWPEDPVTGGVLEEFLDLCSVPHGSGSEGQLAEMLRRRFTDLGYSAEIDSAGNLICDVPATPGYENAPLLALQGHLDMVCAVRDGSGWDPERDTVSVVIDDESGSVPMLRSDGRSSLGADCGIGDAAVIWLITGGPGAEDAIHGPIRVIFTVCEEVGLRGAKAMDPKELEGVRFLVNVDGFSGKHIVAGSAGGRRETFRKKCEYEEIDMQRRGEYCAFEFSLAGFQGGHSGYDIDKKRVNAVKVIAALLEDMKRSGLDYRLASFNGGTHHNVIPGDAGAAMVFRRSDMIIAQRSVQMLMYVLTSQYSESDWTGRFVFHEMALPKRVLTKKSADELVDFVHGIPDGVYAYTDIPQGEGESFVVDTSVNVGKIVCSAADDSDVEVLLFLRSLSDDFRDIIINMNDRAAKKYDLTSTVDEYPHWQYDPDQPLLKAACEIHREITGDDPVPTAVHVGLETSVIGAKQPGMDMISIGAELEDPHSIHERVEMDTIGPLAETLKGIAAWAAVREK